MTQGLVQLNRFANVLEIVIEGILSNVTIVLEENIPIRINVHNSHYEPMLDEIR